MSKYGIKIFGKLSHKNDASTKMYEINWLQIILGWSIPPIIIGIFYYQWIGRNTQKNQHDLSQ